LAYRPGWHLGEIPYALQFNRRNPDTGEKELFPKDFVWAEVEYADDVDYQQEAHDAGVNANGKYQHSLAGLPYLPTNGSYKYRTNPNPETDPWIITGAMRVRRVLKPSEVDELVRKAGREPQKREVGAVDDTTIDALNKEIEQRRREADGEVTDERISYENDPLAKALGGSYRSARQKKEFAARERQRMQEKVESLAKTLGISNEVEIVNDLNSLDNPKVRKAKGWYDRKTGKITVVVPNHVSVADIEQTMLHEAVAHYGLRKLFGDRFDTFLDNVFRNADESIRKRIVEMAKKHNWDFRTATEEYLAGLAENTEFENMNASWWQKIKSWFLDMLHKLGFEGLKTERDLTDNELRYILWRSYENLKEPGHYRNVFAVAEDIATQHRLKVDNYTVRSEEAESKVAEPSPVDNIRNGIEALRKIVNGAESVPDAMRRDDLTEYGGTNGITFYFGRTGNPNKDFKGGFGISHIGAKHGAATLMHLLDVIANGDVRRYVAGNKTVVLGKDGYEVVLALTKDGNTETWMLTGWNTDKIKEKAGAGGEVSTQSAATQTNPTFSREDLGAAISDANVRKYLDTASVSEKESDNAARLFHLKFKSVHNALTRFRPSRVIFMWCMSVV